MYVCTYDALICAYIHTYIQEVPLVPQNQPCMYIIMCASTRLHTKIEEASRKNNRKQSLERANMLTMSSIVNSAVNTTLMYLCVCVCVCACVW